MISVGAALPDLSMRSRVSRDLHIHKMVLLAILKTRSVTKNFKPVKRGLTLA